MHPVASMGKFAAGSQERKGVKYTGTWIIFSGFHLYGENLHFFRDFGKQEYTFSDFCSSENYTFSESGS